MFSVLSLALAAGFSGCSEDQGVSPECVPDPPQTAQCSPSLCAHLQVIGDTYATTPGTFKGYSDSNLIADPLVAGRLWLSYSWLEVGALTDPAGEVETWLWRHAGMITDGDTYAELGVEVLQQPELALGPQGDIFLIVTPARDNPEGLESIHEGLLVLELAELDPPTLARDCEGELVVHATMATEGMGGCTYAAESSTGVLCHTVQTATDPRHVYITSLHP